MGSGWRDKVRLRDRLEVAGETRLRARQEKAGWEVAGETRYGCLID